jgi:Outer membrane efflux protein
MLVLRPKRVKRSRTRTLLPWGIIILHLLSGPAQAATSLAQAVASAQQNDPWITGSEYRQQALESESTAASTFPDPVMSIGLANLPTDTFEFDQEAMTQFKVGVTQMIPRGDSTELAQRRLSQLGAQQPHLRQDRRERVAVMVTKLWLDAFKATETIRLIEEDRALFEHLVDVAQSSYSTAMGMTRQQDLIRAQLELTRLEDRLTVLHDHLDTSRSRLGEWLYPGISGGGVQWNAKAPEWLQLTDKLPELSLTQPQLVVREPQATQQEIATVLVRHPAILSIDAKIEATDTSIQLAEQKYKPEWKLNASYGYRDDAPSGMDRSDFFSFGVAFDLPLFTSNRQDQQVQAAVASTEAVRTERALALRNMMAGFEAQRAKLNRLEERRELYQSRLLTEMHEQAEASLTAYTNDDGDFSEVVRARIAELNARIDALDIDIERLKTIQQINYYFAHSEI